MSAHQLRVHKIPRERVSPEQLQEIKLFLQAIYADRAHTFVIKQTPKHLLVYLRISKRRTKFDFQRHLRQEELGKHDRAVLNHFELRR